MDLYHSFESHYDLLVKEESRIVDLGPLAGSIITTHDQQPKESDVWNTVKKRNHKNSKGRNVQGEKLLEEQVSASSDEDGNLDEIALLESKKRGFKRESPQEPPVNQEKEFVPFECGKCGSKLQSKGLLDSHMKVHEGTDFPCDECDIKFVSEKELKVHKKETHEQEKEPEQWNCNDCPFQANCASELMNHLKCMGHAPSKAEKDKRVTFKDFKQCYTCKREFDGYWNLMTHIKNTHPSNRRCRDYPGKCQRGNTCWYKHVDEMIIDQEDENKIKVAEERTFDCSICGETFQQKNLLKKHKKLKHTEIVPTCEKYIKGQCVRDSNDCWYLHKNQQACSENSVFQQVSPNPFPPEQLSKMFWMMNNLMRKVEGMEKSLEEIMM